MMKGGRKPWGWLEDGVTSGPVGEQIVQRRGTKQSDAQGSGIRAGMR